AAAARGPTRGRRLGAGERDGVIVGCWGVVGGSGTRCVSASDARGVVRVPRRCAGPGGGVAAARRTIAREDTYCISERFLFPVRWYQRRSEVVTRQECLLGEAGEVFALRNPPVTAGAARCAVRQDAG